MQQLEENLTKLDVQIKEWYLSTESNDIVSALTIGYNIVLSNQYKIRKEGAISNFQLELNRLEEELLEEKDKLIREKSRYIELDTKLNMDNKQSINVAVEKSLDYANKNMDTLAEFNSDLKVKNTELRDNLNLKDTELNDLKCKLTTSKTKGEMTEQNIKQGIELNGFRCEKPGNHSGDLFVYSKENENSLVCVLEIKNYGEDNKWKLGLNGSETKKMYSDIETQLKSENPINVPWLFVSLGCEIPKITELRKSHLGVKCIYLSKPSDKELIAYIESSEIIHKLNNNKNDVNIVYIQHKINEIDEIFSKLSIEKPDFKKIKELISKLAKTLDKEEDKFNKLVENSINRMDEILKSIRIPHDNDDDIDLLINIDELAHTKTKEYVEKLQSYSMNLLEQIKNNNNKKEIVVDASDTNTEEIVVDGSETNTEEIVVDTSETNTEELVVKNNNKKECNICGTMVIDLKKHQKTIKCKNAQVA